MTSVSFFWDSHSVHVGILFSFLFLLVYYCLSSFFLCFLLIFFLSLSPLLSCSSFLSLFLPFDFPFFLFLFFVSLTVFQQYLYSLNMPDSYSFLLVFFHFHFFFHCFCRSLGTPISCPVAYFPLESFITSYVLAS